MLCRWPGCGRPRSSGLYCGVHRREESRYRSQLRAALLPAGYRRLRDALLGSGLPCAVCGRQAQLIDHIRPLRLGGGSSLANLQPLCRSCHARKTRGGG